MREPPNVTHLMKMEEGNFHMEALIRNREERRIIGTSVIFRFVVNDNLVKPA